MTWTRWYKHDTKTISITWWRQIRKKNLREYGNDPEINTRMLWGIHTNGAKKGNPNDSCLDWTLNLGHLSINYVNWTYNQKLRQPIKRG